nr:hypothetical protein [Clostridium magnum]
MFDEAYHSYAMKMHLTK